MKSINLSSQILENGGAEFIKRKKPDWLRAKLPGGKGYADTRTLVDKYKLNTVCESAMCPNMGECWARRTATMMILGDVCTRSCGFCHIKTGRPPVYDLDEPRRVGEAAALMNLKHIVITSVNRDELPDGGAEIWAEMIREIRRYSPETQIEVLIPDFCGDWDALQLVLDERPEILNHNLETVPRLYSVVRPQATYERSIELLKRAKVQGLTVKTGIMVGIGEEDHEVETLINDLVEGVRIKGIGTSNPQTDIAGHAQPPNPNRNFPEGASLERSISGIGAPEDHRDNITKRGASLIEHTNPYWNHSGPAPAPDMTQHIADISYPNATYPGVHETCDILTIGQYLQPTRNHLPISRWVKPEQFAAFKAYGEMQGVRHVESGPLVRSSYHADDQVLQLS
ncbi:Lipoyl synthase [Poriferisphaera corsica]|uniref:Lipoyl synthase n=1 Tax=Poriferisphaera corsica TaxID=2528020 RepID=A0A517YTY5_9BACT|nr:lipoyl synthase [Poriferisphaera corsica]QDU33688.1 Lipoyl synthase [Poriferisphaera corsica]